MLRRSYLVKLILLAPFIMLIPGGMLFTLKRCLAQELIRFEDVTHESGLAFVLEEGGNGSRPWRYAHGAGWGDVDGDDRPDLYIGAFASRPWYAGPESPIPNRLLFNRPDGFVTVDEPSIQFSSGNARCSGVLFVDLDNDGDLDLVVANHVMRIETQVGSRVFENVGEGSFEDRTPSDNSWPHTIGARNVSAIDFNVDGLLDLVIADGSYGARAVEARLIALMNIGGFQFQDVTDELSWPSSETTGLGLAVGDVNEDGIPDFFVAGSNRLLISRGALHYEEVLSERFAMTPADVSEGLHCGATFGDLNGDGLLDLLTTEHGVPARIHVFQNHGVENGVPDFVEITQALGLDDLYPRGTREQPIKTAHVALQDMDNDGRKDIVLSVVYRDSEDMLQPVILRNLTPSTGEMLFERPPYNQMVGYYAPGPLTDYDRDGRLDMFLPSWFETLPNILFRNTTSGGNWLSVQVDGRSFGINSEGVGAIVRIYEEGAIGDPKRMLGRNDIAIGTGYASCEEAVAHFGLGDVERCDVELSWRGDVIRRMIVPCNQYITIRAE